jgi:hypothetical protein
MTDALVFDVPVELGLELVPVVRPHLADTEWEALDCPTAALLIHIG